MATKRTKHSHAEEGLSASRLATVEALNEDSKLLQLPVELLTEIVSWCSTDGPSSLRRPSQRKWRNSDARARFRTEEELAISNLCHTCALLRNLILPCRWNEVKSREIHKILQVAHKHNMKPAVFMQELHIAHHVRTLNVVGFPGTPQLMTLLVAALKAMSNLHTLRIVTPPLMGTRDLGKAHHNNGFRPFRPFGRLSFPSVRTLELTIDVLDILKCFPKVTKVIADRWREDIQLCNMLGRHCKGVQELVGFVATHVTVRRLVRMVPNLRSITINIYKRPSLPLHVLRSLSSMAQLSHVGFHTNRETFAKIKEDPTLVEVIKVLKDVLRKNEATAPKTITFAYESWSYEQGKRITWVESIVVA